MRPLLLVFGFLSIPALAAPREFPFTWTSRTSAVGSDNVEAWFTPRLTRAGAYFRLDTRLVWAHGVSRTVESQLSMDLDFHDDVRPQGIDPRLTSLWRWTTWRAGTPFAVGSLGRVSLGFDVLEVEARLFADWQLQRVLVALNASGSRAAFWGGRTGVDTRLEESLAVKYALSPGASIGLELRAKSSWASREYQGTAIYAGPAMTFTRPEFWVTLGGYTQVAADKANADRALPEPNELRDNERFVLRLSFGSNT